MKHCVFFIWLLGMVSGVQAAVEYHEFTSSAGKEFRAVVKAYNPRTKTVTVECDNKRKAKAPLADFSEADQAYILEWESSKFFYDNRELKITCDKRRIDQRKEKEWGEVRYTSGDVEKQLMYETTYESLVYDIEFYGRREADLADLRLVYIVYYEQSEMSWEKPEIIQKTKRAEISIPLIKGRTQTKVETEPVEIYRENVSQKAWVSDRTRTGGEGDVHGFRARLYMKLPSGKELVREFSYPEKLSDNQFPWKS